MANEIVLEALRKQLSRVSQLNLPGNIYERRPSYFRSVSKSFANNVKHANLKPVKKIEVTFDPFHQRCRSARELAFVFASKKLRNTNLGCTLKTNVKSDMTPPEIKIQFADDKKVIFKTENLNSLEILQKFNAICREKEPSLEPPKKVKSKLQFWGKNV